MANIKSAIKRIKKAATAHDRNIGQKSKMKTLIKKVASTLSEDTAAAPAALSIAYKSIDTVKSKGVIHRNKAARLKSRLAKKVNQYVAPVAAPVKEKKVVVKKAAAPKKAAVPKAPAKKAVVAKKAPAVKKAPAKKKA